jgi:hypothetical protein
MVRDFVTFQDAGGEFHAFLTEFQGESDRAAAVLVAAYLDDLLRQLLLATFVDDTAPAAKLVEPERPLGSFAARIGAAYAFGLISDSERFDLDQVRDIRNRFAHRLQGLTFDEQSISDRCRTFKCNAELFGRTPGFRETYPDAPRRLFDLVAALLAFYLKRRVAAAERIDHPLPPLWLRPPEAASEGAA